MIVTDNASDNNEAEVLAQRYWDRIHLIKNQENLWFTWGCNVGMKAALDQWCEYIMLLNNDAVMHDNVCESLIQVMESDSSIWIAGPTVTYEGWERVQSVWCTLNPRVGMSQMRHKGKSLADVGSLWVHDVWFVSWCAMMIKREVCKDIWLLDDDYFAYTEEVDFTRRAKQKWWRCVVVPDVVVEHKKWASTGTSWSNQLSETAAYLRARNSIWFGKKNLSWLQKYRYIGMQLTVKFVVNTVFSLRSWKTWSSYVRWLKDWLFLNY